MGFFGANVALITTLLVLAVPVGYIVLQLRALRRWAGPWRQAAQWSAWVMSGLAAWLGLSVVTGDANGLFPLLFALPIATGYIGGLSVGYWLVHS